MKINLDFKKTSEEKENPYWPELVTAATWESPDCKIREEHVGRGEVLFRVFVAGKEMGVFYRSFSKSLIGEIKRVILSKLPGAVFEID